MVLKVYSWRFKRVATLLDESEYAPFEPLIELSIKQAIADRKSGGSPLIKKAVNETPAGRKALENYRKLTGETLSNVLAFHAVRASNYGAECEQCGRPFRTPKAKICMECGFRLPEGTVAGNLLGD